MGSDFISKNSPGFASQSAKPINDSVVLAETNSGRLVVRRNQCRNWNDNCYRLLLRRNIGLCLFAATTTRTQRTTEEAQAILLKES